MAQRRQNPTLNLIYARLDERFVPRASYPRRNDSHAIMPRELVVAAVQNWVVIARVGHATLEIVRHQSLRATADPGQRPHMCAKPIVMALRPTRFGVDQL